MHLEKASGDAGGCLGRKAYTYIYVYNIIYTLYIQYIFMKLFYAQIFFITIL